MKLTLQSILLNILTLFVSLLTTPASADTEHQQITAALDNYIQGTSYSYPEQIAKAFYSDANLLLEKKNQAVWRVPSKDYAGWFSKNKLGTFTGRIGKILNIDISGSIATAKVEILIPKKQRRYVDLFLMKKIEQQWKIISKTAIGESRSNMESGYYLLSPMRIFTERQSFPLERVFLKLSMLILNLKKRILRLILLAQRAGLFRYLT
jgi:hypothetical protein